MPHRVLHLRGHLVASSSFFGFFPQSFFCWEHQSAIWALPDTASWGLSDALLPVDLLRRRGGSGDESGWRRSPARYACRSSSTLEVTFSGSNAILPERDKQLRTYQAHG